MGTYFYNNLYDMHSISKRIRIRYTNIPDTCTDYSYNHNFQSVLCSRHSDARNIYKGKGN